MTAVLLLLALTLCACARRETNTPALDVGGEIITQSELRYVSRLEAVRYTLNTGNEIHWSEKIGEQTAEDYVRGLAREAVVLSRVLREKAGEYGCLPDAEDDAWITAAVNADREAAGAESFDKSLASADGTAELYRLYVYETPLLEENLLGRLFFEDGPYAPTDEVLEAYHRDEMVRCSYVYLSLLDDDGFRLTGEEYTRLKRVAEALRREAAEALSAGDREAFYELVRAHGQDYAMSAAAEGLTLPKSDHGEAFRAAVDHALPGEISDVVETQDGFYIILTLEQQEDYIEQNREEIENAYRLDHFDQLKAQWRKDASVQELEGFASVKVVKEK